MQSIFKDKNIVSQEGYDKICEKIEALKKRIPEVIDMIAKSAALGDLKENSEYHAAKEEQNLIDEQIGALIQLKNALKIVKPEDIKNHDVVNFYATITVFNGRTEKDEEYLILSQQEADFSKNIISNISPFGSATMGKKVGDTLYVHTPRFGEVEYEIKKIEYKY